jgi:Carboxypeptidase regulatory-like domain
MWSTKRLGVLGLVLAIAWLYAGATCGAQALNGSLSGNIVDESGALVPGADVSITNDASQDVRRTVTNGEGFFTFASVPPGTYTVRAQLSGFKTAELTGVVIRVGDSRSLGQITLAVGGQTEQIVVALQSDMVPLNSGEKSATLTADQIENIPIVGRSATELLKILPGLSPRTVRARSGTTRATGAEANRWI